MQLGKLFNSYYGCSKRLTNQFVTLLNRKTSIMTFTIDNVHLRRFLSIETLAISLNVPAAFAESSFKICKTRKDTIVLLLEYCYEIR